MWGKIQVHKLLIGTQIDAAILESNILQVIFLFETKSQKIAQAGLELMIFLAQPPECWDYRCASPYQI
jgi:hypothetical protein